MPKYALLAIPVFNEEGYVDGVLEASRRHLSEIVVIDDGSTDRTPEILACHDDIAVITHPENRGYGKSLADAFCFAARHGYEWLITMDCDDQHEPSRIPAFLEAADNDDADIISGTRYPDGQVVEVTVPSDRRAINRRITALLNERLGLSITDAFCGFKAYRVASLANINITVPGYAMPMQFWVQAVRANLRIRELPVRLIYNDPTRHFGGLLDDPTVRVQHYLDVFESALCEDTTTEPCASTDCQPCR